MKLKLYTVPESNGFGIAYFDDFGGGQFVQGFRATFKAAQLHECAKIVIREPVLLAL